MKQADQSSKEALEKMQSEFDSKVQQLQKNVDTLQKEKAVMCFYLPVE